MQETYADPDFRDQELLQSLAKVQARLCSVFSEEKRLRIMWFLSDGERRVNEIAEHLGISVQNTSQHLRVMRDRGAVSYRKEGHAVYYSIANQKFQRGYQLIREGLLEELRRLGRLG
jgi:DNA-binding transcriptional ArsR family regulator